MNDDITDLLDAAGCTGHIVVTEDLQPELRHDTDTCPVHDVLKTYQVNVLEQYTRSYTVVAKSADQARFLVSSVGLDNLDFDKSELEFHSYGPKDWTVFNVTNNRFES